MFSTTSEPEPGLAVESEDTDSDEDLMAAIRLGDQEAFSRFYDRHAPPVFSLAMRIARCHTEAESVVSDVFFEVWRTPDRFDTSRGACRTYLLMLTRSRAIDRIRAATTRSRKTSAAADHKTEERRWREAAESPCASLLVSERRQQVRSAVAGLTPEQREPLELSFFGGLTHREIAQQLNEPLGTVKTRIRAGMQRLRAALGSAWGTPQEENNAVP